MNNFKKSDLVCVRFCNTDALAVLNSILKVLKWLKMTLYLTTRLLLLIQSNR